MQICGKLKAADCSSEMVLSPLRFVIWVLVLVLCAAGGQTSDLEAVLEWKHLQFEDKVPGYIPEHNVPVGLEIWKSKLFLTIPRWRNGIASSLAYVDLPLSNSNKSPALKPYPDWSWHQLQGPANHTIVSPFRVRADECDRLWVLDTGKDDILGSSVSVAPTQILVFDLKTDRLLRRIPFSAELMHYSSFFANIAVDVTPGNCEAAFAYSADLGSSALVVYSWARNTSWRVTHHYFHMDPMAGEYQIGDIRFHWDDGLFGIALSTSEHGYRTLYFHPFSSFAEFSVSTEILRNSTLWTNSEWAGKAYNDFKFLGKRGPNSQAGASFMDEKSGILFYTQVNKNSVGCWNSGKPFSLQGQLSHKLPLEFANDIKVDKQRRLWVLTDRMEQLLYRSLQLSETNFRVFSAHVDSVVEGTVCASSGVSLRILTSSLLIVFILLRLL